MHFLSGRLLCQIVVSSLNLYIMNKLMARIAKVKNSSEIIRAMEEPKSPWHQAQEYVNIKLTKKNTANARAGLH